MLVKYVLVHDRSGDWYDMGTLEEMDALATRTPGTHVERWLFPSDPSGHGTPVKYRVRSRGRENTHA